MEPDVTVEPRGTPASDPWQFLLSLNSRLNIGGTPHELIVSVLDALTEIPEIAAGWVAAANENGTIVPITWLGAEPPVPPAPASADSVCRRAILSGKITVIDDLQMETNPELCGVVAGTGWRAAAAIPIIGMADSEAATVPGATAAAPAAIALVLQSAQPGFFSKIWPRAAIAHLAAVIDAALQACSVRLALHRARAIRQMFFGTADLLRTAAGETEILEKLCRRLVDSGLFVSATIGHVNAENIWAHRSAAARPSVTTLRSTTARHRLNAPAPPLNLLAWQEKKTLVANHYATDRRFQSLRGKAARNKIAAAAAVIIRRRRKRWAVLSVTADGEGFFDDDLVQALERLADMVGHALNEMDLKRALRAEREAQHRIARRDPLTGLPNRLDFTERLNQALSPGKRAETSITIIKLDLDDFRFVNERFGRAGGDFLLTTIAGRLAAGLTAPNFAGRMGGDEFAILLENRGESQGAPRQFLERLNDSLCQPVTLPNGEIVQPGLRAGVSVFPRDHADADQLLRHAEMALFAAKADRRTGPFWRLYQDIMPGGKEPRFAGALLQQGALRVVYQPVVELFSGKIVSVEALARLQDGGALLQPAQFLHDMLPADRMALFRQVVETSVRQLQEWDASGTNVSVSINIDAQILLLDDTIAFLRNMLAETGLDPARLCLELLETHEFPDLRLACAQIEAVRALGLRAALDDLGAGYSSILKIRELPLDTVKLDRAFVAGLRQRPDDLLFVAVFQTLTAARGMTLIVEGVETEDVLDALNMMGVRCAQGFKFAEPMAPNALRSWLDGQRFSQRREPRTLLGAYAVHLAWLRAFSSSRSRGALLAYLRDEESFSLDAFFHHHDLISTSLHDSYMRFRAVMHEESSEIAAIAEAAARFRAMLMAALKAEG